MASPEKRTGRDNAEQCSLFLSSWIWQDRLGGSVTAVQGGLGFIKFVTRGAGVIRIGPKRRLGGPARGLCAYLFARYASLTISSSLIFDLQTPELFLTSSVEDQNRYRFIVHS